MTATDPRLPNRQPDLDWLLTLILQAQEEKEAPKPNGKAHTNGRAKSGPTMKAKAGKSCQNCTIDELMDRAFQADNGDKISRLYNGDKSDYGDDDSKADLAFCSMMAFWCGPHGCDLLDRIFRTSRLMREKWNRDDYRKRTLDLAFGSSTFHHDYGGKASDNTDGTGHQDQGGKEPEPDVWGDILPIAEMPTTIPFPNQILPDKLQKVVTQLAYAVNVPEDAVGISMLTMAGAAVGNGKRLEINNTHEQHAAIYAAVVMRPGERKTAVQSFLRKPFDFLEMTWRQGYEQRVKAKKQSKDKDGEQPLLRRCLISDTTVETLIFRLRENPQGLLYFRDELTSLVSGMNQYKGGSGSDRQAFLELWNGDRYACDRKSQDTYCPLSVDKPFLSILGCLQPDTLPIFRGRQSGRNKAPNDGFADRFLIIYPDPLPAVGDDPTRTVLPSVRDDWHNIVRRLFSLGISSNAESDPSQFAHGNTIHFDGGARDEWEGFTWRIASELNNPDCPDIPELRGVWSKLVGYGARIALIVQMLRWACGDAQCDKVDATSMEASTEIVEWLKSHARKTLHASGCDERASLARALLTPIKLLYLSDKCTFKRWELHKRVKSKSKFPSPGDLDSPLELLAQLNYIRMQPLPRLYSVGRSPEPTWHINPAIRDVRDNREYRENSEEE